LDALTIISLLASISSLVLAIVAIWIALYGKSEADKTNRETQQLLSEIRSDAKSIAQHVMPELQKYGESFRKFVFSKDDERDRGPIATAEFFNELTSKLTKLTTSGQSQIKSQIDELLRTISEKKEDVISSAKGINVAVPNGSYNFASDTSWEAVIEILMDEHNLKWSTYGQEWSMHDFVNGKMYPKHVLKLKDPFGEELISKDLKLSVRKSQHPNQTLD